MAHVLGSFNDSGFHRDFLSEEVKIKTEPGVEASPKEGTSQTERMKDLQIVNVLGGALTRSKKGERSVRIFGRKPPTSS